MTERGNSIQETSEQVGNRLLEFVGQAEFGSSEYQAISDYFHLTHLEKSLKIEQANARKNDDDPEGKDHWQSQARITEQQIAIHKAQIYHHQTRLKGYDTAYTFVGIGFEHDLADAARREAESLYAQDPHQQDFYKREIRSQYFSKAETIIDEKKL